MKPGDLANIVLTATLISGLSACGPSKEQPLSPPATAPAIADIPTQPARPALDDFEPVKKVVHPITRARLANGFVEGVLLPKEGTDDDAGVEVGVFRGIPYAQPPVGGLRFRPPKPSRRWQNSLLAQKFSPGCWRGLDTEAASQEVARSADEDCLYLNVFTTARTTEERRPVIVVLHGGDPLTGDAAHWIYDGRQMARRGAVVVTFNYRLGVLGFLAHPALSAEARRDSSSPGDAQSEISGNYGLLDQIAALRWVKLNIAAFGGNPNSVTVLADEQGSVSLRWLLISPLAKDLINRAIAVGGAPLEPLRQLRGPSNFEASSATADDDTDNSSRKPRRRRALPWFESPQLARSGNLNAASAEELGTQFLSGFHTRSLDPLDTLREAKVEKLLTAARSSDPFTANIDGVVLTEDVSPAFRAGRFARIPLLLGWSHDPPTTDSWSSAQVQAPADVVGYRRWLAAEYGDFADDFFGVYGAATDRHARDTFLEITMDRDRAWPMRTWARWNRQYDAPSYLFVVSRTVGGAGEELGASELIYGLGNVELPRGPSFESQTTGRASPIDLTLSNLLSRYWYNFARSGDPNNEVDTGARPLAEWPIYDRKADFVMQFGDAVEAIALDGHSRHASHRLDVFDALFEMSSNTNN